MAVIGNIGRALRRFYLPGSISAMRSAHGIRTESDEEFDQRYIDLFSNPETDHWRIRMLMNDLHGMDLVPAPKVIEAALRACRRVNEYALTVRFLEAVKLKCGPKEAEIWPYILQEIKPTLEELGIDTPEQLGYHKPELHLKSVFDD